MADDNLDKYLEDIGIDVGGEAEERAFPDDLDLEGEPMTMTSMIIADGTPQERIESFLVNLLLNFDPAYAVEITRADESEIYVDIYGGDPGKIIGRGGRTLSALEYVTNAVLNRSEEAVIRVNIDVGGYKQRRDDRLRESARKAASRARKTGRPVEMEIMSAAERRVIHMVIAEDPGVRSESSGEGRSRRVVIFPVDE
jgi:spoIIIJ-associated protein